MNYYIGVLKKYAVFAGRARRKEYWTFILWNIIITIVLTLVLGIIGSIINNLALVAVCYLYTLAVFIPSIAVLVRRLHDTGRSGWWFFISLVPLIGSIVLLVFLVKDSQPGDNQYGPNPKEIKS
jgi:uncharacterized membrane protein YhaH (DUF805 family)